MYFPLALCAILSLTVVYSEVLEECKKFECPEYKLVEKKENYEVRKYPAYKMALVKSKGLGYIDARKANFFKLFRYQQGNNNQHHSFPMVYPILNKINVKTWKSGDEEKEVIVEDQFGMGLYIPKALHNNPPQGLSTKDGIKVLDLPENTMYVVSFPGFANKDTVYKVQKKLHDDLKADGVEFNHARFFVAEYNEINTLWSRHNELWMEVVKEGCDNFECPAHKVVEKKKNYEVRKYPPYKMAVVNSKGLSYTKARRSNFFKLYRYQQGNNDRHHSFPMVYPIVTKLDVKTWTSGSEKKEEIVENEYGMGFYIPKSLHDDPPHGSSEKDKVKVLDLPGNTMYVVSFPGFANKNTVYKLQKKLHDDLKADGVEFNHSRFFIAEYNKINTLWNRRNELWYVAK